MSVTCGRFVVSSGSPVSSTNKTDRHDINEVLLKVALNTIKQTNNQYRYGTFFNGDNLHLFFLNSLTSIYIMNCVSWLQTLLRNTTTEDATYFWIIFKSVISTLTKTSGTSLFLLIYRTACMNLNPYYMYILNCCPCLIVPGLPSIKNEHDIHLLSMHFWTNCLEHDN